VETAITDLALKHLKTARWEKLDRKTAADGDEPADDDDD
jgi:hypothetical protein